MEQRLYQGQIVDLIEKDLIRFSDGFEQRINPLHLRDVPKSNNVKEETFGSIDRVLLIKSMPCAVCGDLPSDNAHVVSRGSGGTFKDIVPLCRKHHLEQGNMGIDSFQRKYGIDLVAVARKVSEFVDIKL